MSDDDCATPPLAHLLRALADEVARDPDLAARVMRAAGAVRLTDPPTTASVMLSKQVVSSDDLLTTTLPAPNLSLTATVPDGTTALESPAEDLPGNDPSATTPQRTRAPRTGSRFGSPTIPGRGTDLGQGVPDPFALWAERGEDGLRVALDGLRAGTLRAIIRAHQLDPLGKMPANAPEPRMRTLILNASRPTSRGARPAADHPASGTRRRPPRSQDGS